jgi:hypothetical protein
VKASNPALLIINLQNINEPSPLRLTQKPSQLLEMWWWENLYSGGKYSLTTSKISYSYLLTDSGRLIKMLMSLPPQELQIDLLKTLTEKWIWLNFTWEKLLASYFDLKLFIHFSSLSTLLSNCSRVPHNLRQRPHHY